MKPAFNAPKPSYIEEFSLYILRPFPERANPIIPSIRPTKKQENTIEQIPSTSTAVEFGKDCF